MIGVCEQGDMLSQRQRLLFARLLQNVRNRHLTAS